MGILSAPARVDKREYWGFCLYDWANSGYVTTVATVLFAPYLTSVAETAACRSSARSPTGRRARRC
jgi:UMF1 family MFS transporter